MCWLSLRFILPTHSVGPLHLWCHGWHSHTVQLHTTHKKFNALKGTNKEITFIKYHIYNWYSYLLQLSSNAIIENNCFKEDKFKKHQSLTITQNDMNHYKIVMILSNSRFLQLPTIVISNILLTMQRRRNGSWCGLEKV